MNAGAALTKVSANRPNWFPNWARPRFVDCKAGSCRLQASVLACAKHFLGDGGTADGVDQGNTICDEATLRKLYLPPYVAAIKAGVGSIMVSYSSWNGRKMHGNKHLLTDVLKGELGFQGFLVSDWAAIDQLSPDYKSDVADFDQRRPGHGHDSLWPRHSRTTMSSSSRTSRTWWPRGKSPITRIDDAVSRILRIKFQMGLFDKSRHRSGLDRRHRFARSIARWRANASGNRWFCSRTPITPCPCPKA